MNTCMRCNEAETTGALCAPCRREVRAAISAEARPFHEARAKERAEADERSRRAWNRMLAGGAA